MARKQADPYWTIRGVSRGEDVCLVIEAASMTAAECFAIKRGVEVVFVTDALPGDVAAARAAGWFWRYTPEPRLKALGRPVSHLQAACLVLCGLATVVLNLRANRVPMSLPHLPRVAFNVTHTAPTRSASMLPPADLPPRFS